jgi:hypothetical protein
MSPSQRYFASAATSTPAPSEETHHETPMEVSEGADGSELQEKKADNETENQPPTGLKLALILASVLFSMFLVALVWQSQPCFTCYER